MTKEELIKDLEGKGYELYETYAKVYDFRKVSIYGSDCDEHLVIDRETLEPVTAGRSTLANPYGTRAELPAMSADAENNLLANNRPHYY